MELYFTYKVLCGGDEDGGAKFHKWKSHHITNTPPPPPPPGLWLKLWYCLWSISLNYWRVWQRELYALQLLRHHCDGWWLALVQQTLFWKFPLNIPIFCLMVLHGGMSYLLHQSSIFHPQLRSQYSQENAILRPWDIGCSEWFHVWLGLHFLISVFFGPYVMTCSTDSSGHLTKIHEDRHTAYDILKRIFLKTKLFFRLP